MRNATTPATKRCGTEHHQQCMDKPAAFSGRAPNFTGAATLPHMLSPFCAVCRINQSRSKLDAVVSFVWHRFSPCVRPGLSVGAATRRTRYLAAIYGVANPRNPAKKYPGFSRIFAARPRKKSGNLPVSLPPGKPVRRPRNNPGIYPSISLPQGKPVWRPRKKVRGFTRIFAAGLTRAALAK